MTILIADVYPITDEEGIRMFIGVFDNEISLKGAELDTEIINSGFEVKFTRIQASMNEVIKYDGK